MDFQTAYKRNPQKLEGNNGVSHVETAGYIPPKQQIESFMLAGRRLADVRRDQYDFEGDIDENIDIRARAKNYDLADATQDLLVVEEALRASQTAAEASQEAEKQEKASDDAAPIPVPE
jgi:hypothetical protein